MNWLNWEPTQLPLYLSQTKMAAVSQQGEFPAIDMNTVNLDHADFQSYRRHLGTPSPVLFVGSALQAVSLLS